MSVSEYIYKGYNTLKILYQSILAFVCLLSVCLQAVRILLSCISLHDSLKSNLKATKSREPYT